MTEILNYVLNQVYIQFTFQLVVCISVFLIGKAKREYFVLRLVAGGIVFAMADILYSMFMYPAMTGNLFMQFFYYPAIVLLFFLLIWFCYEIPPFETLITVTGGYAAEHVSYAAGTIMHYALGLRGQTNDTLIKTLIYRYLIYVAGAALIYRIIVRPNRGKESYRKDNRRIIPITIAALVTAIVLSIFYSQEVSSPEALFLQNLICPLYSLICCLLILFMLYDVLRENRLKEEKKTMDQLLQMAEMQQKTSKEAIDIINIKCHDLKHQIRKLNRMGDEGERSRYVREINQAITIYDATYHTGCEALDYILREKSLLAQENNIAFSCMADGTCMNRMDPPDLYALMGNALDNALEHEKKEPENERSMSLRISQKGQMILIHLENRCSISPQFKDGIPQTDKADKDRHGFGIRSIRFIAQKYGGDTQMVVRNGNFVLNIMLPAA